MDSLKIFFGLLLVHIVILPGKTKNTKIPATTLRPNSTVPASTLRPNGTVTTLRPNSTITITAITSTNTIPSSVNDPIIVAWKKTTITVNNNSIMADVHKIQYSSSMVYVSCADIPSYTIGPWPKNPNIAKDQNYTFVFSRTPTAASTKTKAPLGHIGLWINGVSIYNADDGQKIGAWSRNAYFFEKVSFDSCKGHADGNSKYHHHVNPICLYNTTANTTHSPLIGFAFDGFPVYGIFAYSNGTNTSSSLKRMRSSYAKRNITVRQILSSGIVLSSSQYGPVVNSTYPLGAFLDDYVFVSGYGDLDVYNGRFAKTPEYPSGTYAYFVTTDSAGDPEYPYTFGPYFYGSPISANMGPGSGKSTPTGTVQTYFSYSN